MNAKAVTTVSFTYFALQFRKRLDVSCCIHKKTFSFVDILIILLLKDQRANQQYEIEDTGPLVLNAFDMIILSQGLNLASIFDRGQVFGYKIVVLFAIL